MSIDVLLPAALAFIMFSVGLALRAEDFRHVFQAPRALLIGLCGQLVLVPLAALAVVFVFDLPPALGIGLMILAACPGGASSGFLTHVARGNAALSLTLTVISSLAALATFPLLGMAKTDIASPHVWLPLPEQWRAEDFVEAAAADGVTIAPTHSFVVGRRPMPHAVRLCIGSPPSVEALQIACERLERLLGSQPKSSFET